jgi:hypothetical protein
MIIRKRRSNDNGKEEKRREGMGRDGQYSTLSISNKRARERGEELYQYQYIISQESIKYSLSFLTFYIA